MKMMKAGRLVFFTAGFIILMMMVSVFVSDAASDPITITLDGKTVSTDADPIMVQNRTMVPVSVIVGSGFSHGDIRKGQHDGESHYRIQNGYRKRSFKRHGCSASTREGR